MNLSFSAPPPPTQEWGDDATKILQILPAGARCHPVFQSPFVFGTPPWGLGGGMPSLRLLPACERWLFLLD